MARERPRLEPVPGGAPAPEPRPEPAPARPRDRWIPLGLGAALALTLALLVWSRLQLGGRIADLEAEVEMLRASVARRDAVIDAQTARLDDVRSHVTELQELLAEPLPRVEEP